MATREVVKGHCGNSKCTYDVYTKEKVDELLAAKDNEITALNSEMETLQTKTNIREETINIPFNFKVQNNSNGVYNDAYDYGTIEIPVRFSKTGNLIGLGTTIVIAYGNAFAYENIGEKYGFPAIKITLPMDSYSSGWRWVAETTNVPEKYKMWSYEKINDDDVTTSGLWYKASNNSITLYSKRSESGSLLITHVYHSTNTD